MAEPLGSELDRLRLLLLAQEREALSRLADRLGGLERYVGDPAAFRAALSEALADALRDAHDKRGKTLSNALAPAILAPVRRQIKEAEPEIFENIERRAGALIDAAIAQKFQNLLNEVQRKLDAVTSGDAWRMRLQSAVTGKSVGEIMLGRLADRGVRRILLIDRQSGGLLAQWPDQAEKTGADHEEMIGALIAAVMSFAEEALEREGDGAELRSLDLGGRSLRLYDRGRAVLAIEMAGGALPPERLGEIDSTCKGFLEDLSQSDPDGEVDRRMLEPLAKSLLTPAPQGAKTRSRMGAGLLLGGLAALLIGWGGWTLWRSQARASALARVEALLAESPDVGPYALRAAWSEDRATIHVGGLLPPGRDLAALEHRLTAAAGAKVDVRTAEIGALDVGARVTALERGLAAEGLRAAAGDDEDRRRLTETERALRTELAALRALQDEARAETQGAFGDAEAARARVEARLAALSAETAALSAWRAAPETRLRLWAARTAIFFGDGATPRDPAAFDALEEAGAILNAEPGLKLRVIGHVDRTGPAALNERLARERAEVAAAALVARGARLEQIIIAARPAAADIASRQGPGSQNRRVEFEAAFPGE